MTAYVALLRGINLAGRTRVGMAELRRLFTDLGHADAQTYLQSGNVVFTSSSRSPDRLARDIEKRIADQLGLPVEVLLRSAHELAGVAAGNPFSAEEDDPSKLHVTFLADRPGSRTAKQFAAPAGEPARFAILGREVFLHCPQGYGRSKLSNAYIERKLDVRATTRSWKTVSRLVELSRA